MFVIAPENPEQSSSRVGKPAPTLGETAYVGGIFASCGDFLSALTISSADARDAVFEKGWGGGGILEGVSVFDVFEEKEVDGAW